jgi:hypothetical protein
MKEDSNNIQESINKLTGEAMVIHNNIEVADERNEERANSVIKYIEMKLEQVDGDIKVADARNEARKDLIINSSKEIMTKANELEIHIIESIRDSTINLTSNIQKSNEETQNLTGQVMISLLENTKEATTDLAENQFKANEKIIQAGNRLSNIALQTQEELTQIKENMIPKDETLKTLKSVSGKVNKLLTKLKEQVKSAAVESQTSIEKTIIDAKDTLEEK